MMSKWEMVRLEDVCTVAAGQGAPQNAKDYSDEGIPFIRAGHLSDLISGTLLENDIPKINETVAKTHKLKLYPKGTILFAKSGMSCTKGYIYRLRRDSYVVNHLACLIPKAVDSDFLAYALLRYPPNCLIKDESYPSISLTDISAFSVPLPPLPVQNKIVDILDHVALLIKTRKAQIEKMDLLVKSRFVEMFGDPVMNPMGWDEHTINDICSTIVDCPHSTPKYTHENTGFMCIRTTIIKPDFIDWERIEYISEEQYVERTKRYIPKQNDIVYSREGAILGIASIINNIGKVALGQRLMLLSANPEICNFKFLCYLMNSPCVINQVKYRISGSASPHINVADVKNFTIPLPSLDLQHQFADFAYSVEKSKITIQRGLKKTELLYKSLMQKCFNGEIPKVQEA